MTSCTHTETREIDTRPYMGPVSRDENRAAHGGVTSTVECTACGARRRENRNGRHGEIGPWGPTLAERRDAANSAVRAARARVAAAGTLLVRRGEREIRLSLDRDGYLLISGEHRDSEIAAIAAAAPALVDAGRTLRTALSSPDVSWGV